ncbi:MAG: hypothetical protein NTW07_00870, partial [candidate division Zixibacteria bacterium]|nr:hypothetical protein [candidate division Zixibacteria bacterium]
MTDLRKRLSVTTLAFLALAFCGLLIGQAVANSERARDVNADYSIETGVPLPSIAPRAPQQSGSLSEPIAIDEDGSAIYQWEAPSISNDKHQKEGSGVKSAGTFSGGGDTPGTATVIAALPYTDSGDLTGAVDDYPLDCGFGDPGSPTRGDLFYSFTPAASAFVTFSLCNSVNVYKDFVIKLWEGDPSTTGVELTCDEDGCVAPDYGASKITGQFVAAGVTYYLQIKCWSATAPAYVLDVYLDDP